MRIFLACPVPPRSLRGNRVTAARWARLLRRLGHQVTVGRAWSGKPCDLMIALHARKSFAAIAAFRQAQPRAPLVVCLTGTDVYHDLPHSSQAQQSLDWADRLVLLQAEALKELRPSWRAKARVIHQSLPAPAHRLVPTKRSFQICLLAHLRKEKDPLRAGLALRFLPADSRIRVVHAGRAMTPAWAARARRLMSREGRYRWLGELPRGRAQRLLARSHALVVSSRLEGGANVVSEAIVLGVPVLASKIPGNIGLLGSAYAGYYALGDELALARLMRRAETDPAFYRALQKKLKRKQSLFRPNVEARAWASLLKELW